MATLKLHDIPHPNIYNVQPTSDTSKARVFPALANSKENPELIIILNLQFSHIADT